MIGNLNFKRANKDLATFTENTLYLCIKEGKNDGSNGIFIDDNKQITFATMSHFHHVKTILPIKDVVCIYTENPSSMTIGNTYSVYKIDSNSKSNKINYQIYDDSYKKSFVNVNYFIDKEEYKLLADSGKLESKIKEILELINKDLKIKEENAKIKSEEEKSLFLVKKTLEYANNIRVETEKNILAPKKYTIDNTFIFRLRNLFNKKSTDFSANIRNVTYLERLNILPDVTLGKIKRIENNIYILDNMDISNEILHLIKDSVYLTISLLEYNSDLDTVNKLNHFLDNTINYCNTLKNNKMIEESYIKAKLAENINSVIDKNSSLFQAMVQDGDILQKLIKL